MRAYFFGNFYLSSIQQGIQAAHCVADMFMKYHQPSKARELLFEWATSHKTMILLNGGTASDLKETYLLFRNYCGALNWPYEMFMEDMCSLNNATTCVGIVVPEQVYMYNDWMREHGNDEESPVTLGPFELMIAECLSRHSLAR